MAEKISSPSSLIKKSVSIFFKKETFIYFLSLMLVVMGIGIAVAIVAFGISGGAFLAGGNLVQSPIAFVIYLALMLVFVLVGVWGQAAMYESVYRVATAGELGVRPTLVASWKKLLRFFLTSILLMLVVFFGFILFIIPGMIFAIWFSFAQFIAISEGLGPGASLARSRQLIKGRFWAVAGRLSFIILAIIIAQIALSIIPFVGALASMLFAPLFLIPSYLLYRELSVSKSEKTLTGELG